jgi:hypothetical protein
LIDLKLLTLLHLHTDNPPQSWAVYDRIESGALFEQAMDLPYNPKCVKMFGEDYGKLVDYDSALVHTSAIMSIQHWSLPSGSIRRPPSTR